MTVEAVPRFSSCALTVSVVSSDSLREFSALEASDVESLVPDSILNKAKILADSPEITCLLFKLAHL